jgi:Lrp/AsnC family leucine-responsive transcriptional regulator
MKYDHRHGPELDTTDLAILELLQENCKQPLAAIGAKVGLTAPSVNERIHKLEEAGVISGYVALLEARRVGKDVTAFIGVSSDRPRAIESLERDVAGIEDVQECHHVTGGFTLIVKVKTRNTETLERLIEQMRALEGITRTETMVVLSTSTESPSIAIANLDQSLARPTRRSGPRERRNGK